MSQKNIFSVIGAILVLQGLAFYLMATDVVTSAFPNLDEAGKAAPVILMQVMAVMSVALGLIAFASRNATGVAWAYCIGFALFSIVSLKHLLVDNINVPIPAVIIQIGIVLACAYLWMRSTNPKAALA